MMFNGLLMCGDSDTSDFTKDSIGASSSLADTGSGTWDASARAQYYHNKLLSTLQVLQNKEETVRIQSESLRVAEARIAKLTTRAEQLRNDLEAKANEVRALRRLERCKPERADAAVTAEVQGDCTCGLEEENMKLKHMNESMQIQLGDMRERVSELEMTLAEKEQTDQQTNLQEKENELSCIRQQLSSLTEDVRARTTSCETLTRQLQQAQVSIEDQTRELVEARRLCNSHETTISHLHQELDRANTVIEKSRATQAEMQAQAAALAGELARAHQRCCDLRHCYREKCSCSGSLQQQLEEARARGAALVAEVRRVVAGVRAWLRRARRDQRERDEKIMEQESIINALQQALEADKMDEEMMRTDNNPQGCSKCTSARKKQARKVTSDGAGCSKCSTEGCERRGERSRTSGSEMASCSSAPTPPKRLLRKKSSPCDINYVQGWLGWRARREAGVQLPRRAHAACCPAPAPAPAPTPSTHARRPLSPTSELEQRVSALQLALQHSHARWTHAHTR